MKPEHLRLIDELLPESPEYFRRLIVAWLEARKLSVCAVNVRHVYKYLLGQMSYMDLLNHFDLDVSPDSVEEIL